MKNIDKIYYINLEHRIDRKQKIEELLDLLKIDNDKKVRFNAHNFPENGSLGCVKSHLDILIDAKKNNYKNCLILEDDFRCDKPVDILNSIEYFFNLEIDYDVIMLSSNLLRYDKTNYDKIVKVNECQTSAGYIINNKFFDKLIEVFTESVVNLELDPSIKWKYALDQNWKKIQPNSNWYSFYPTIGYQEEGYSDIEQRDVNYGC